MHANRWLLQICSLKSMLIVKRKWYRHTEIIHNCGLLVSSNDFHFSFAMKSQQQKRTLVQHTNQMCNCNAKSLINKITRTIVWHSSSLFHVISLRAVLSFRSELNVVAWANIRTRKHFSVHTKKRLSEWGTNTKINGNENFVIEFQKWRSWNV